MSAGEGPTGVRALDLSEKGVQSWIGAASPGSRPQRLERQEHRESETEGHSVVATLRPLGVLRARILEWGSVVADSATPGGSPGQNPGVGSRSLLQEGTQEMSKNRQYSQRWMGAGKSKPFLAA